MVSINFGENMNEIVKKENSQLTATDIKKNRESARNASKFTEENSYAESTERRYKPVIDKYELFCKMCGVEPWRNPNEGEEYQKMAEQIHSFISSCIVYEKIKHPTVKIYFSSLSKELTRRGWKILPTKSPILKDIPKSAKRQNPYTEKKSKALTKQNIVDMINKCDFSKLIDCRDAAIIAIKFCSGCRDDEIAKLETDFIKDKIEDGYIMRLPWSKTGKIEKNVVGGDDIKLVHLMNEWIRRANISEGLIFHEIKKGGKIFHNSKDRPFKTRTIRAVIKKYVKKIGLDPKDYAGHSTRRGLATFLIRKGVSLNEVRKLLSHSTSTMTLRYEEEVSLEDKPVAKGLL